MRFFPGATYLLKGATFTDFWFLKNFLRLFNFLFLWLHIKDPNYMLFKRGLCLFEGLCLLFLQNVLVATFIQGGTFFSDSRVRIIKILLQIIFHPFYHHISAQLNRIEYIILKHQPYAPIPSITIAMIRIDPLGRLLLQSFKLRSAKFIL